MSNLNMTSILQSIKRRLGITMFKLDDKELLDILKNETLYTFSTYFPHYRTFKQNLSNSKVPGKRDHYYINRAALGDFQVLSVEDIKVYDVMSSYMPYATNFSAIDIFADIQMNATFEDMLSVPVTYYYAPPDQIVIQSGPNQLAEVSIEVTVIHPSNGSTISPHMRELLLHLGKLDIEIYLYQTLRHLDKIETSFGTVDLKIDEWADAEDKRISLLEEWDANFLASRRRKIYRA